MAEQTAGEKTEEPTGRRKSEAREEGQVGRSVDLSNLLGMIGAWLALQSMAPYLWQHIVALTRASFSSRYFSAPLTIQSFQADVLAGTRPLMPDILIILAVAAFCGAGSTAVQTNFLWSWKLLKPKLKAIKPTAGIKRIFSLQNGIQLAKSIAKLFIIGPIAFFAFRDLFPQLVDLTHVPISDQMPYTAFASNYIFWRIVRWLLILAILDLVWQKYYVKKQLKMSKQEVKDEQKSTEGDEGTRRRIRQIAMQRIRKRMLKAVQTADVVVTNPTHIAVALKYSMKRGAAPLVVAKGRGYLAERIKELARSAGVPVVEQKPLARALFKAVEVGQEIPYELYQAVAEILAYVYRLKGKVLKRTGNEPADKKS